MNKPQTVETKSTGAEITERLYEPEDHAKYCGRASAEQKITRNPFKAIKRATINDAEDEPDTTADSLHNFVI